MGEKETVEAGNSLPPPLDSSRWFAHGWKRAMNIPPDIAHYPKLAAERLPYRLRLALRRNKTNTGSHRPSDPEANEG